jgi:hypothetical protein
MGLAQRVRRGNKTWHGACNEEMQQTTPSKPTRANAAMQSSSDWIGKTVDFEVSDAFIPTPSEILMQRYGHQILQGHVVDLTADAARSDDYAVLRVGGVSDFVIVPCRKLRRALLGPVGKAG